MTYNHSRSPSFSHWNFSCYEDIHQIYSDLGVAFLPTNAIFNLLIAQVHLLKNRNFMNNVKLYGLPKFSNG